MDSFEKQFLFFESQIENLDKTNPSISSGSVGWHIAHCTLVMDTIANAVAASNMSVFKRKFSLVKSIIFITKKIPRGKGKAPARVMPKELISKENLIPNIINAKKKVNSLNMLNKNNFFEHPYFGNLHLKDTFKFFQIHNNHHIKIIKDIKK